MQLACIIAYFSVPALSIVAARCVYVILLYCRWETISRAYLQWRQSEITYMEKYVLYGVSKYERLLCAVGRKMVYVVQIQNKIFLYKIYEIFAFSDGDVLVPTAYSLHTHSVGYSIEQRNFWIFEFLVGAELPQIFLFILFHIYSCLYVWMSTLLFLIPLIYTVLNMNLKACDIKTLNSWLQSDLCVFFNLLSELPSPLLFPLVHLVLR